VKAPEGVTVPTRKKKVMKLVKGGGGKAREGQDVGRIRWDWISEYIRAERLGEGGMARSG
jgi:hypothetical protein